MPINTITLVGRMEPNTVVKDHNGRVVHHGYFTVTRKSGAKDTLPIIVPMAACKFDGTLGFVGKLRVVGEIRTTSRIIDGQNRHVATVYAKEVTHTDDEEGQWLEADGVICTHPTYRMTPLGREISDLTVAVRHSRGSDYIPVVTWGRTAQEISKAKVGDIVHLRGRFQSRPYRKKLDIGGEVERTAFEVSAKTCQVVGKQRRLKAE